MNDQERGEIKQSIIDTIAALEAEMVILERESRPVAPDCSLGRLTRVEAMQEQERSLKRLHEAKIRLNRLQYALRKVDTSEYGFCAECEEPISPQRLRLMPEAGLCIRCAR